MNDINPAGIVEKACKKSRNLTNYRLRSESELRMRLSRYFDEVTIDFTISQMYQEGFLDDKRFAHWWVETKTHSRPVSANMIQNELMKAGIQEDLVKDVTCDINDTENALKVAIKRSRATSHLSKKEFQQRMEQYLRRRGFSFEVANTAAKDSWELISD